MAYVYYQFFGVEQYVPLGVPVADTFGGGAKLTNDNLLMTLWNVTSMQGARPTAGKLLKPFQFTQDGADQIAAAAAVGAGFEHAFDPCFASRYSARIMVEDDGENEAPLLSTHLLAVLRPPQDLVNSMLQAIRNVKPSSGFYGINFDFNSFWFSQAWGFEPATPAYAPLAQTAIFGGIGLGGVPFCKTNGADGNFPEFFDLTTPTGLVEEFETLIDGGEFYVPCVFTRTSSIGIPEMFTFSWPYATGRR